MRVLILVLALGVAALPSVAPAVFDEDDSGYSGSADLGAIKADLDRGHYDRAETDLLNALALSPDDPDVLGLLGFANRKMQRYDKARKYYVQALSIDPQHRNALEYMGELELETGNPDAARALLGRLSAACPTGCDQLGILRLAFRRAGVPETVSN